MSTVMRRLLTVTCMLVCLSGCVSTVSNQAFTPGWVDAQCSPDSVKVGSICMDKYEASVWDIPATNTALIRKVRMGTVTVADLGGVNQVGVGSGDYNCANDGKGCAGKIYAVSVSGVQPSGYITWFQAQQACANSLKRLPTNAEWQMAVSGTPDSTATDSSSCNVTGATKVASGSMPNCVSAWGVYDMGGNMLEWVTDWTPLPVQHPSDGSLKAKVCPGWKFSYTDPVTHVLTVAFDSDDAMCFAGSDVEGDPKGPAALQRGGFFGLDAANAALAGPLTIEGRTPPWAGKEIDIYGFRCAR